MYKRRMRKRIHDLKRKFLMDTIKAQEFETKLNFVAHKNKGRICAPLIKFQSVIKVETRKCLMKLVMIRSRFMWIRMRRNKILRKIRRREGRSISAHFFHHIYFLVSPKRLSINPDIPWTTMRHRLRRAHWPANLKVSFLKIWTPLDRLFSSQR